MVNERVNYFLESFCKKNRNQPEFVQSVVEVLGTVSRAFELNPHYFEENILERIIVPDREMSFKICWEDDKGCLRVNTGYRVQFNNALGPYKGGLRFHPSVNSSILKFLGFEQTFKNSLTGIPMGGGKGGADFDPKGKSIGEIARFCQSMMNELYKYIGDDIDVPAGDIGVGEREIGFLFGQYKKITNKFHGCITGKGPLYGGSLIRREATGYGLVYFAQNILAREGKDFEKRVCVISGAGNVAQYTAEKLIQSGAVVVSMSDSQGAIFDRVGFSLEKLEFIKELRKNSGSLIEYRKKYSGSQYFGGKRPWGLECEYAFPCATQNEISLEDAKELIKNGCKGVFEGANMPISCEALEIFKSGKVIVGPGKAANAGGVSVSGIEMHQNSGHYYHTAIEVDEKLKGVMKRIFDKCMDYAEKKEGYIDFVEAVNLASFIKVADSMIAQRM